MTLVIDASVAVKWVLPELDSDRAAALRVSDFDLIAPTLVVTEIGNAIWKGALRGDVGGEDAPQILRIASEHFSRLVPAEQLMAAALALAITLKHPIYDCFYLALAERERALLVTADRRLITAAKQAKGIEVRAL